MKTQIIHLDKNDDLISTRDKLMWVKMSRVVLVFPPKVKILNRPLDLVLLQRFARRNGSQLAIVTQHKETISQCEALHILHFPSSREAQHHNEWKSSIPSSKIARQKPLSKSRYFQGKSKKIPDKKNISVPMRILLISLVIISVLFAGLFFIPSATINLQPEEKVQNILISISAGEHADDVRSTYLPAEEISVPLTDSLVIPATGTMIIPDGFATGTIRFENLTETTVGIPEASVVLSPQELPIKFVTLEDVVVPSGLGEFVEIEARALEPGFRSNVELEEISVVEGLLGSMVSVSNTSAFKGGSEKEVAAPTAEDWQNLETSLLQKLKATCESEIIETLSSGDIFLSGSDTLIVNIKTIFPAETQPAELISILMDAECKGRYVKNDVILAGVTRLLDENLPAGFMASGNVTVIDTSRITKSEETYQWTMTVERSIETRINTDEIIQLALGKNRKTIAQTIKDYLSLSTTPGIKLSPRWWMNLPVIAWRIQVEIVE